MRVAELSSPNSLLRGTVVPVLIVLGSVADVACDSVVELPPWLLTAPCVPVGPSSVAARGVVEGSCFPVGLDSGALAARSLLVPESGLEVGPGSVVLAARSMLVPGFRLEADSGSVVLAAGLLAGSGSPVGPGSVVLAARWLLVPGSGLEVDPVFAAELVGARWLLVAGSDVPVGPDPAELAACWVVAEVGFGVVTGSVVLAAQWLLAVANSPESLM